MDGVSSPTSPFRPLPAQVDLPALEHEVLDQWATEKVFARSLEASAGRPQWTFYEGPPTANGRPGTHHIEARAFKDVFPRFKTMQGYSVPRRAGWDCHGLPVEIAVEKELGFSGKPDIEAYGIAEFNARCRESVERHVADFSELTDRMGYWVDMSTAYWTMNPEYVESVWWSLKTIFDKGLLTEDHRVAPYCPRCGTGLSDHEVAQGYETVTDPSVYVSLPITSGEWAGKADLLVWTTTPWTLPSNTAVAVNPDVTYVVVRAEHAGHRAHRRRRRAAGGRRPRGRRALRGAGHHHRPRLGAGALPAALLPRRVPRGRRALRAAGRLRHHRQRHRPGAPVPRLRRRGPRGVPVLRAAGRRPGRRLRALRRRRPAGGRALLQGRRPDPGAGPRRPGRAVARAALRAPATRTAGAATRR